MLSEAIGQTSGSTAQATGQPQQSSTQSKVYDDIPALTGIDLFQVGPGFNAEEEAFYRAMQRRKKKKRRGPKMYV